MITVAVPARAGLAGNPSDAYGGAAVAVPVPALAATVEVDDADALRIVNPTSEAQWTDVAGLLHHAGRYGHDGGQRLITAALARLARQAGAHDDAFELRWSTTIPRSVGLAGSSALVVATLQAIAQRWQAELSPLELAHMALAVEQDDLGIPAGLMDRAVQAFGCPVLVDGEDARPLSVAEMPRLVAAWSMSAAQPSQGVHGPLRARFRSGEPAVVEAMERLTDLGRSAARALESSDGDALAACARATFAERQGLGVVAPEVTAMVAALGSIGVTATSAGSGGAVVGVLPAGTGDDEVRAALAGLSDGAVIS